MNPENASQRLVEAETKLARAVQRLRNLQRAALYGQYSASEFDEAVMAYREARSEAYEARNAWAHWHAQSAGESGTAGAPAVAVTTVINPETESFEPLRPTQKLLFARWLVKTGRLTEWPDGYEPDGSESVEARRQLAA